MARRWDAMLLLHQAIHRRAGKLPLLSCLRISRDLFEAGVARDGRDLVRRAACLREPSRRCPAQSVRDAAFGQARFADPCRHEIAEALRCEGAAKVRLQDCSLAARRR